MTVQILDTLQNELARAKDARDDYEAALAALWAHHRASGGGYERALHRIGDHYSDAEATVTRLSHAYSKARKAYHAAQEE